LSSEEKQVFQEQFAKELAEYKKKIAEIEADPDLEDQLSSLKEEKAKKRTKKAYRKARLTKKLLMKN
jgi:hypothetical protein